METVTSFLASLWSHTDDLEITLRIIFQVLLLASSAIFSGSETALFSLSRIDLEKLRNTRNIQSENIHALLDEPRRLIISILCGNELVNIASAANMAVILMLVFGEQDVGWLNILVMVPLLLLVGEVTPKTIAVNHPIRFSTKVTARILPKWIVLIAPIRAAVRTVADYVTTVIVGEHINRANILQPDELRTLLEESEESGVIDASERVLMDNLLWASEMEITHIMTPSTRVSFIDADLPLDELFEQFRQLRHPRVPVYSGHWDNVIGVLHSEILLRLVRNGVDLSTITLDQVLKPAHFVPPTKTVDEMFDYFQEHNTRFAIVLGEYGEVLGIVTMKDVIKSIFGEIAGTMTGQEEQYKQNEDDFIVPGDMRLPDFYNFANFDFEDPIMTTVGGYAFRLFDRLPKVGENLVHEGFEFTILGIEGLRISKVRVRRFSGGGKEQQKPEQLPEGEAAPVAGAREEKEVPEREVVEEKKTISGPAQAALETEQRQQPDKEEMN